MNCTVHVVEPGGWGGVHQHAAALAAALTEAGVGVRFHTAAEHEHTVTALVNHRRPCSWRFDRVHPAVARRALVAGSWLAAGMPSVLGALQPGDVLHVEGWFKPALLLPLVGAARSSRCRVTLSPHNTFSRHGLRYEEWIVRSLARRADAVFAFSEGDRHRIEEWGARAVRVPLVATPPHPNPALVDEWRRRWGRRPAVLFAGQIRADKGLDLLVQAVAGFDENVVVAVVGQDQGGLDEAVRAAARAGLTLVVDEGYQPLERFVAALAAADVIVCPYRRASQSSILAHAAALGRPSVATDVGGLAERATVTVPPNDPAALREGIERALEARPAPSPPPAWPEVLPRYLAAYGLSPLTSR